MRTPVTFIKISRNHFFQRNMQQSGTLKKRCRRTLVKVHGLGTQPYSADDDNFNVRSLFANKHPSANRSGSRPYSRATRDPLFHMEEGLDPEDFYAPPPPGQSSSNDPDSVVDASERPLLFSNAVLNRLRMIVTVGMLIGTYPWRWNKRRTHIETWNRPMTLLWKVFCYLTTAQSLFIFLYQLRQFMEQYSRDLESYRGIFAYFLYIYWYAFCLCYKITTLQYQDLIRNYINTLLKFNKEYVEKYARYIDKQTEYGTGRLVLHLAIPAAGCQILNSVLFFLIMPYQPWYFMSKIYPKPWYWLIPGALQDITVIGHVIIMYTTTSWLTVSHTNSMEFWLRETHKGNESGFTVEELRSTKTSIETYRALQLLCAAFNDCLAPQAIPIMKGVVALGLIPCGFLLIRSMNHVFIEEFPGILVYPVGVFNCAAMGFGCLSMCAEMYDIANSFIQSWSRTKQKDLRRILLSCPTLKVKVSKFYYVTTATTITFFHVISDYIIDCIITFP